MARILVTGSTDGLGRSTAESLLEIGHEVIVHARNEHRTSALKPLVARGAIDVVADLGDLTQTRAMAARVDELGPVDAVIHNAGIISPPGLIDVNVVAPYILSTSIARPRRLIFLSSSMHRGGSTDLAPVRTGRGGSYSDSKLLVTMLALAFARIWPETASNAVDPGWVPTKMGGSSAPDDFELGYQTQLWLAVGTDATTTGGYWHHRRQQQPHPAARDEGLQDALLSALAERTGIRPSVVRRR